MLGLVDEVFASRNDPEQLDVNEAVINRLQRIHPACVSEYQEGNGPLVWVLIFPSTTDLMQDFVSARISEKELFEQTPEKGPYTSLYLCSALVLPEHRHKGLCTSLSVQAVQAICRENPIQALFVWPFSKAGERLAEQIAHSSGLKLYKRASL